MSFTRIFRWTCDACKKQEEIEQFGGPKGWMWKQTMIGVKNFCGTCAGVILADGRYTRSKDDPKQIVSK